MIDKDSANDSEENLERKYPSVSLAYDLAIKSYDLAVSRADAMDSKIQSLVSLSCALTFAIPIVARSLKLDLSSPWFVAIIATFVIGIVVSIAGRLCIYRGNLIVIDPDKLYKNNLLQSEWEFKRDLAYYAGKHFKHNVSLVNGRWRCAVIISSLLVAEVLLMAFWMTRHS